jgi:O-antigen ligase
MSFWWRVKIVIKSNRWGDKITRDKGIPSPFPFVITVIVLLLGGGLGMLIPFIVGIASAGVNIDKVGTTLAMFGPLFWGLVISVIAITLIILLRQDELAVAVVLAINLCVDWYLGILFISEVLALALLVIFFLARSPRHTWAEPRALWLWALFLVLTIYPAIRGALTARDTLLYYPDIIFGALIMFWLGTTIARSPAHMRRFFQILSVFAALIALHAIIQAITGVTLFGSSSVNAYIASQSDYILSASSDVSRVGSFFIQPDFSGTFFGMMILIPIGLFAESTSILKKILYLAEICIFLTALLFTYSIGSWFAAIGGAAVFLVLVGRSSYRVTIPLLIISASIGIFLWFPSQVNLLIQHATDPSELIVRNAIWETGLRVIQAFPLTGVGLGHLAYLERSAPYLVLARIAVDHPHNSYLEWGAMAGLPVLLVFLALLAFALWLALRNWVGADAGTRSLLGAGIAAIIALSINSWSIDGWTLPPLAATGWMILGIISSPLLRKSLDGERKNSQASNS